MWGVSTAAVFLVLMACGAERPGDGQETRSPIAYETILNETYSGLDEALSVVVRDEGRWQELWDQIHRGVSPRPPPPRVDFSEHMLIAVATGARRSGGFGITVQNVAVREGNLDVEVLETCPAAGAMVSLGLTQPVAVVSVAKLPHTPLFRHIKSASCP
jgi:hypothetical protein